MRCVRPSVIGVLCFGFIGGCATAEDLPKGLAAGTGGVAVETGGTGESGAPAAGNAGGNVSPSGNGGSGSTSSATGGRSVGSGGGSSEVGSGGSGTGSGGTAGAGGACFLGICFPATGGAGGAFTVPDAGTSHKAMCNQKLCIDPVFDCILQGCADAVCQIPFCVIK